MRITVVAFLAMQARTLVRIRGRGDADVTGYRAALVSMRTLVSMSVDDQAPGVENSDSVHPSKKNPPKQEKDPQRDTKKKKKKKTQKKERKIKKKNCIPATFLPDRSRLLLENFTRRPQRLHDWST